MARIAGVDLPREKRIEIGLTYVYGIGRTTADKILAATGINPDTRVKDLTREEEAKIRDYIDEANIIVEGDLRRNVALDIKRLVEIQSYRGIRHRKNLPCRGQRTKTNARTCKGPKRTRRSKEDIEKWLMLITPKRAQSVPSAESARTLLPVRLISSLPSTTLW